MYSGAGHMLLEDAPECRGTFSATPRFAVVMSQTAPKNGPAAIESIAVTSGLVKLHRSGIGNLSFNSILALGFGWGIRLQPIEFSEIFGDSERHITPCGLRVRGADVAVTETTTQKSLVEPIARRLRLTDR
jgi:hypothetical protein